MKSNVIDFNVTLTFSKNIKQSDKMEIAKNIAKALVNEANTAGLAPENSKAFTVAIQCDNILVNLD